MNLLTGGGCVETLRPAIRPVRDVLALSKTRSSGSRVQYWQVRFCRRISHKANGIKWLPEAASRKAFASVRCRDGIMNVLDSLL